MGMLREMRKANPDILIESNLRKELKASLDAIKSWYTSEQINAFDDENDLLTAVCLLKDLVDFIETVIRVWEVKDPEVVIGADSGQNKERVHYENFGLLKLCLKCISSHFRPNIFQIFFWAGVINANFLS